MIDKNKKIKVGFKIYWEQKYLKFLFENFIKYLEVFNITNKQIL